MTHTHHYVWDREWQIPEAIQKIVHRATDQIYKCESCPSELISALPIDPTQFV